MADMTEETRYQQEPISIECQDGKHAECSGEPAWDPLWEDMVGCYCPCHKANENPPAEATDA